jgi:hypothetical protein
MRKPRGSAPKRKKPDRTILRTHNSMKRFVDKVNRGQMFFTRECLDFGTRAAIDKWLSRRVKDGTLKRLARGCFMLNDGSKTPAAKEIAAGKEWAFGKQVFTQGVNCLRQFFDFEHKETALSYATNGASSKFESVHGTITYKAYAPRKLTLGDTTVGKIIRALWHHRDAQFATAVWLMLQDLLGRTHRQALRNCGRIMPTWLVKIVKYGVGSMDRLPADLEALLASLRPAARRRT